MMENKDAIKTLVNSMVKMGKISTVNSLECFKYGFEAFKETKIPVVGQDGQYIEPYKNSKELQYIVNFMIIYLEEAIKQIDNKKEEWSEDGKIN